jgi:hypothetical protein
LEASEILLEEQKTKNYYQPKWKEVLLPSNLGMFGIVEFNSIINQPNSAILSVGAIVENQ